MRGRRSPGERRHHACIRGKFADQRSKLTAKWSKLTEDL